MLSQRASGTRRPAEEEPAREIASCTRGGRATAPLAQLGLEVFHEVERETHEDARSLGVSRPERVERVTRCGGGSTTFTTATVLPGAVRDRRSPLRCDARIAIRGTCAVGASRVKVS